MRPALLNNPKGCNRGQTGEVLAIARLAPGSASSEDCFHQYKRMSGANCSTDSDHFQQNLDKHLLICQQSPCQPIVIITSYTGFREGGFTNKHYAAQARRHWSKQMCRVLPVPCLEPST